MKEGRILVTGAEGFIGSHLVERLRRDGHAVRALVLYGFQGQRGWLEAGDDPQLEIVFGDVRDPASVEAAVAGCTRVVHLAAQISVPYSYENPDAFVQTNVNGLLNLLQAARRHEVRHVVHTSSSEVYGTARTVPMDETHPLSPQSPYAASKAAADHLAWSFYCSYGVPLTIVRPFNTYGPRQSPRAIVPTILTQLRGGRTLMLGTLESSRDFLFVDDLVEGYLRVLERDDAAVGEVFHFGTGIETPIYELVDLCRRLADRYTPVERDRGRQRPERSEVERLVCSAEKAKRRLGWDVTVSLEEGVRRTWDWMDRWFAAFPPERGRAGLYDAERY